MLASVLYRIETPCFSFSSVYPSAIAGRAGHNHNKTHSKKVGPLGSLLRNGPSLKTDEKASQR